MTQLHEVIAAKVALVRNTPPQVTAEASSILRSRLLSALLLLFGGLFVSLIHQSVVMVVADQAGGGGRIQGWTLLADLVTLTLLGAAALLLRSDHRLEVGQLRVVETAAFLAVAITVAIHQYFAVVNQLQVGEPGMALAMSRSFMYVYFFLMVVYGLLVPNVWPAALRIVAFLILLSPAVTVLILWRHPTLKGVLDELATFEQISTSSLMLVLGGCTVVYGAHVINSLRCEVLAARRFGHYRLTERIGSGGMGEVWKADHQLLARPAAIKLIRPERLGGGVEAGAILKRFEREVQATARLQSPNTVQVYDFGITDDGVFYYVMELLKGLDLETLVERYGPVPAERAAHFLIQICESLAEAHEVGMVHRDVKPANIFSCRCAVRVDFVKVLDFGLVKHRFTRQDSRLTLAGTLTGTPAFIAPEAATQPEAVDGRADLYSLGCVAYWLLTGQPVFEGDSAVSVVLQHLQAEPIRPSKRGELPVPSEFEELILACLEKDPADRPASALELAESLRQLQFDNPWDQARARRWWETHLPSLL